MGAFTAAVKVTLGVVLTLALCFSIYNRYTADVDLEKHRNPPIAQMSLEQKASHMISYLNEDGRETALCTGTAIGRHLLLTASHCNDGARKDVSSAIKLDYSDHHYHILNMIDDDRDHQIYRIDGPAFVNIVPFIIATPMAGDSVHFYGFGEGVYPSSLRSGRVRANEDPSDINFQTKFFLYDLLAYHGDSGSAIYNQDNQIVGLVSYGIVWYGHEKTGSYAIGFTQKQIDSLFEPKKTPDAKPLSNPFKPFNPFAPVQ